MQRLPARRLTVALAAVGALALAVSGALVVSGVLARASGIAATASPEPLSALPDAPAATATTATRMPATTTTPATPAPTPEPTSRAVAALPASAIVSGSVDRASLDLRATYDVRVGLDYGTRRMTVSSVMRVTNTSGREIDRLELNTVAARLGAIGGLAASVDGRSVRVTKDDQTLIVPLGGVLPRGASATVTIGYRATLRADLEGSNWLFTRANRTINAYRWLPWISRRVPFDRPNHGDPFVTPVSPSVRVEVTLDRPMRLATSGEEIAASGLTHTFRAENVRDFTITASPDFRVAEKVVGDTTVRVYYRPGGPRAAMLAAAVHALTKMNALVGAYPYRSFRVAQSAGGYGMESPALIWVPTGVRPSNLSYLVHHETAHQWFYGVVGGDQAAEPFTDEAVTDFLARYTLSMRRASRCATARLDLSIYRYSSSCYYEVVYIQGGNFLDRVRRSMGSAAFWRGLRTWIADNRYGIASTRSLLDALDAATPRDVVPTFEPRFPRLY